MNSGSLHIVVTRTDGIRYIIDSLPCGWRKQAEARVEKYREQLEDVVSVELEAEKPTGGQHERN